MTGERLIKIEDISFESDTHNIYEPFYSSESDDSAYSGTSSEDSCYDSESQKSSYG